MKNMIHKVSAWVSHAVYKVSEWIGAVSSWILYQAGIPIESTFLAMNPTLSSIIHGFISMLVPVGSWYLILVSKRLLEDKESWVGKANEWVVLTISFKRKVVIKESKEDNVL